MTTQEGPAPRRVHLSHGAPVIDASELDRQFDQQLAQLDRTLAALRRQLADELANGRDMDKALRATAADVVAVFDVRGHRYEITHAGAGRKPGAKSAATFVVRSTRRNVSARFEAPDCAKVLAALTAPPEYHYHARVVLIWLAQDALAAGQR